jgi:Tfp pilus assembly protein PilV
MGLIEVLIAMVLLGVGAAAVLAGMATSTRASAAYENQTNAFNALGIASEAISSPDVAYDACTGSGTYADRVTTALAGAFPAEFPLAKRPSVSITSVQYWNGTGWDGTCRDSNPTAIPAFDRMQQLTLTATVPNSPKTYTVQIIKRAA